VYADSLDISYLTDLPTPPLVERLKHLPPRTIVLLTPLGKDSAGVSYNANESGPMVVKAANAPVFSLVDRYLNHGEVGGDLSSATEEGRIIGKMALRILNGEKPQQIPIVKAATDYIFDWQAVTRWGLKEKDLPPGSIVLNRELTFWQAYQWYVVVGTLAFLAQTLAILGLTWQRARRRKAEIELRKSEERFSKSFRLSPLVVTITGKDSAFIEVNETFEQQSGWRRDEVLGRTPADLGLYVEADERLAFEKQLVADGSIRDFEIATRRRDGQIRTALVSAEVIDVNNEPCVLSVVVDITERKQAEDALSSVSRRLIEAHEEERTRIARELHDDINLRLAMVAVNLETLKQDLPSIEHKVRRRLDDLCSYASDLTSDVQALSHRLHSSKLDYLGLEAACAGFCKELSEQQSATIGFHASGIPDAIPTEIALPLFRVLQEALHNAVKYSGIREFEVILAGTSNEIRLIVRDPGAGFDIRNVDCGHGLGLTSMRERLKLVHGTLSIDSKPQHGTTVMACVPLVCASASGKRAVA
ncbi:MAG TPA: PAS domain S-box protein, partial [Chroococcales cyanobacterium]